jgi:hypothetical protein
MLNSNDYEIIAALNQKIKIKATEQSTRNTQSENNICKTLNTNVVHAFKLCIKFRPP